MAMLAQWLNDEQSELLRFVTVGSVDDGKSTLIGRMLYDSKCIFEDQLLSVADSSRRKGMENVDLSMLLDGLEAEREQGITIDVAYRYFATARRRFIIADTPGHEQYTKNSATGASNADLALVLIDAVRGIRPQTRRHVFIASLFGIRHVVLAINKMDLVGYDEQVFEAIRRTAAEFSTRLDIPEMSFIPVSALAGDNVVEPGGNMPWYHGPTLLEYLETVRISGDRNLIDLRLPVQYVIRYADRCRGYAGQIASGVIRKGDAVMAVPSGRRTRVKRLLSFDGEPDFAFAPQSVTVELEDEIDVSRGDMLVHPKNLPNVSRTFESMLVWMSDRPMSVGRQYVLKHACSSVRAMIEKVVYRIDVDSFHREPADALALNEIGRVRVSTQKPLAYDAYRNNRMNGCYILIDAESNDTIAAGVMLDRRDEAELATVGEAPVSQNITRVAGEIGRREREKRQQHPAKTVWLTGLSGAGKSTLALALEKRLFASGKNVYVLDGDNMRFGLNRDLGFSAEDRRENIRRVAETAALFNDAGLIVITAFISPYREDRERAREIVGADTFLEVFVDTPLAVCERRDPKGLYRKARSGQIDSFTGISAPYEVPENPAFVIDTSACDVDEAVDRLCAALRLLEKRTGN